MKGGFISTTSNIRPTRHSTTTSISHPVPESTNRYSILPVEDTNEFSLDDAGCQSPPKPTKRPASSSSRVNASIKKTTTISSPIVTTTHQSRPPLGEFQAAVTHAQSDGAEQAPSANSDQAALPDGKVPPWGSSRATSTEEIAVEGETSPGTERNARRLKSKSCPKRGLQRRQKRASEEADEPSGHKRWPRPKRRLN